MNDRLRKEAGSGGLIKGVSAESGFALIELLTVMIILGILAAIAIPAFYGQRAKARDAEAKQALGTAQVAAETFSLDHDGRYTGVTPADLAQIESTLNGSALTVLAAGSRTYRIQVVSDTGSAFYLERLAGGLQHTCNPPGSGGCPSSGNW